jgi:hypothetical protein
MVLQVIPSATLVLPIDYHIQTAGLILPGLESGNRILVPSKILEQYSGF